MKRWLWIWILAAPAAAWGQASTGLPAASAMGFTGSLSGDVTGTQSATTVGKINGGSVPALATVLGTNASSQLAAANMFSEGTFTTGTTAVGANTCTPASTVSVTGVTASSVFIVTASADTSSLTGWGSTGGLVLDIWPTSGTLNYKICNQTSSSITPGAATWNYLAANRALQ